MFNLFNEDCIEKGLPCNILRGDAKRFCETDYLRTQIANKYSSIVL